ncbi:NC domain protein [Synechococcus sp. RSCCF101]|uniref:lecithin retinol acyltransferase family protein n=1 Tax=Synechococcus sp. RSCCF101 TaxID=2511069 RepID=UPI001244C4F3|nr:lecithin retinol acyltransferase family protein [Synechococcus sp. RSCCF101]QEY32536.1 NC domain protein [Synechococcus sp. RSCCF101]
MAAADHITVPRRHGLFLHHGIDLGDGTVAHYLEGREILRSPLSDFASDGGPTQVVDHDRCDPAGVTLRRAMGRIGEQRYNLLFNNCEHFATWCKTGRHRSRQVEDWLNTGVMGALAVGQLMPAALLAAVRLLLRQGLRSDEARQRARQALNQLETLRQRLLDRLETTLEQAEAWVGSAGGGHSGRADALRLAGQRLADELAAVEDLEERLDRLLGAGQEPGEGP